MFKVIELYDKNSKLYGQGIEFTKTKRVVMEYLNDTTVTIFDSIETIKSKMNKENVMKEITDIIKEVKVPCVDCKKNRSGKVDKSDVIDIMMKKYTLKNEYINFEGNQHCDENCDGWDGEDKRCDCGNRRVMWSTTGDIEYDDLLKCDVDILLDEETYKKFYPEAY